MRRGAVAGRLLTQLAGAPAADLKLLTRTWRGGPVLKQRRLNGLKLLVRADEDVGREIYFFGQYERDDSELLLHAIRETDVCVDIGASCGYYTLGMALAARKGRVHAFEPVPLNYHILMANLLLNGVDNAVVKQMAVGEADAETELVVSGDSGYSSLINTGRRPVAEKVRVPMTTLDGYCDNSQILRVDCLKIDAEGAEDRILAGGRRLLADRSRQPRLIMLEMYEPMLSQHGSSIENILQRMRDHGYTPFVNDGGRLTPFVPQHYNRFVNVFMVSQAHSGEFDK